MGSVVAVISWFAIVFTGRWPDVIRRFVLGTARLIVRITAYGGLLIDRYPPFSLDEQHKPATRRTTASGAVLRRTRFTS